MAGAKTTFAKPGETDRQWMVIDAKGQILGRMATRLARVLMGKDKVRYTPHVDTGDGVIVINAAEVAVTGQKAQQKTYQRYSGYPGGRKVETYESLAARRPEQIIRKAVKGMLPDGILGRQMLKKLRVYKGSEHPHQAQQPLSTKSGS